MVDRAEVTWCKSLKKKELLEMATVLANHALPAWNNFHFHSESKYELRTSGKCTQRN